MYKIPVEGNSPEGWPKIFKTSRLFHYIPCILDFLERDRILYLTIILRRKICRDKKIFKILLQRGKRKSSV